MTPVFVTFPHAKYEKSRQPQGFNPGLTAFSVIVFNGLIMPLDTLLVVLSSP